MAISAFYRGMAYPFQQGNDATPAPAYDDLLVRMSLEQLLQTRRGERVMRPNFGCDIFQYVFENNDDLLIQLLRTEIAAAIAKWEPRARLNFVDVTRPQENVVSVLINYTVITTGNTGSFTVGVPAPTP